MPEDNKPKPSHVHIPSETVEVVGGHSHRGPSVRTINKEDLPAWRENGWRLTSEPATKAPSEPQGSGNSKDSDPKTQPAQKPAGEQSPAPKHNK